MLKDLKVGAIQQTEEKRAIFQFEGDVFKHLRC